MLTFPNEEFRQLHRQMRKDCIGEDVIVLHDVSNIPYFAFPYSTPYTILSFIHEGYARGSYNLNDIVVGKGEICVVCAHQVVTFAEISSDFRAQVILISPEYASRLQHGRSLKLQLDMYRHPVIRPSAEDWQLVQRSVDLFCAIVSNPTSTSLDMIDHLFEIILKSVYEEKSMRDRSLSGTVKSRAEHILEAFVADIYVFYKESHDVGFYAKRLCITPNYLSKACIQTAGIPASLIIRRYIIMKSQALLKGEPQMSIQQIGMEMGFQNQSVFCKYFKKATGLSPGEYRKL